PWRGVCMMARSDWPLTSVMAVLLCCSTSAVCAAQPPAFSSPRAEAPAAPPARDGQAANRKPGSLESIDLRHPINFAAAFQLPSQSPGPMAPATRFSVRTPDREGSAAQPEPLPVPAPPRVPGPGSGPAPRVTESSTSLSAAAEALAPPAGDLSLRLKPAPLEP